MNFEDIALKIKKSFALYFYGLQLGNLYTLEMEDLAEKENKNHSSIKLSLNTNAIFILT